ncbi:putative F0F1-ATPase subunit [Andreesenia angusta]|uniref:Putative F0F1-ATPase subunit n=1 Tax=Andreesenia angusta TaxID=39480 RepID=A0A1S1V6D5_9FIRM|nr:AtpZ/AtpI family protein [Andreesenia angusta]OHW61930.1 putative F0F1-ATPase subunit [Andreesenia angusta]
MKKDDKNLSKILTNLALVSQIGTSIVVMIGGGVLLGNFLDKLFGTNLVFLVGFTVLGVASAFYYIYKMGVQGLNGRKKRK